MSDFPFLGGSGNGRSPTFDASRTVNLYVEKADTGGSRGPVAMYGTPGLRTWLDLGAGPVRGCIVFKAGIAIVIAGGTVWRVTSTGASESIGSVASAATVVSIASNGSVIMMVDGANGYFIDPIAKTVTPIINENFIGADRVDFVDGYFVWNKPGTGQFQTSGLYKTDIDGLDFATAEGGPDNIVSLIVDHRELWLLGENTTEVWYNAGGQDFAFQRIQGAFLEVGCAAPQSVAKMDNSIYWLARDDRGNLSVQRAAGYQPQRVSNHAVEFAIASYARVDDAIAYTYTQEGHAFLMLTFPTAGATWCLDASTGEWHERAYRDPTTAELGRHRSNCQMQFAGLTLVGDCQTGKLFVMSLDVFDDDGDPLPAIRRCGHITADGRNVIFEALELFMQAGVGLSDGPGSNPQAMLRWSDDGGYSWSNEVWRPIGRIGERRARVRWQRLGMARDRVFEVTITDPVRRVIVGANLTTIGCLT